MKQPKKIFTRMLINNWGGISHKMLEFHEYVNLFSGKSGSGKSTVMDAIQVVLYGSVSANFLNKAADDSKNKRSVLSYLRGAQKDGTANRGDVDFCSQIVLEIEDTATHIVTCVGAAFEVAKGDTDLKKYTYFSHSGRIPKDEYLENNVPYSIAQIRKLTEERSRSADNRGRGEVNKVYPSKEAYLYTLYGEIFGQVEQGRMITMEKSAIALKMTSGTGQFIRDYMFPKTKEDTVATISEQLGAYREIKERVEDLEKRIEMLDKIQVYDRELTNVRAEKVRTETVLKCIDIEENIIRLKGRESELESVEKEADEAKKEQKILQDELQTIRDERARVQAELNNSDYGKKEQELKDLEYRIALLADNSAQWRQIVKGLKRWEEEDVVTDYVSNRALQLIQEIRGGALTEKLCKELRTHLDLALDNITNELSELRISIHETEKDIKEKQDAVEDLQNDRKPYPLELKKARQELQRALSDRYGRKIEVHIFADLFDITDEKWKNAIEGRLGRIKKSMITEPAYALDAAKIFRRMQQFEEVDLINSEAVQKDSPEADENSLYKAVHAESGYVDRCLKRYLGRIQKCETVEELSTVKDGVTPDCYSYSGYMFRHLRRKDYTKNACIGTKVSKAKLRELQEEIIDLQSSLIADRQTEESLKEARQFERFGQEPEHLMRLAGAADELADHYRRQDRLKEEIKELKNGTLAAELQAKTKELTSRIEEKEQAAGRLREKEIETGKKKGKLEEKIKALKERLDFLMKGYVPNDEIFAEVRSALETKSEAAYKKEMTVMAERLFEKEIKLQDERIKSRNAFNNTYPAYGFSGVEHDNEVYDKVLERCRKDFEPKYKEEFEKQYELVYHSLRDNVIATIHGEIKSAYRHRRQINKMLSQIRFSDSIYQIDISPAKNENGQFYEMLMAEELDSKVIDHSGFDGQMSLMEDEFFRKYERKIGLLTEKFMPSERKTGQGVKSTKMKWNALLTTETIWTLICMNNLSMKTGSRRKIMWTTWRASIPEERDRTRNMWRLLAGFAMLYMQQSNRDSKIRLVLLDEAFSKMDKERSEVCLKYARELELQLIVCVPDERLQSLIRNVDSVYGFRRFRNQVTMMHIDKGNYLDMIAGESRSEEV